MIDLDGVNMRQAGLAQVFFMFTAGLIIEEDAHVGGQFLQLDVVGARALVEAAAESYTVSSANIEYDVAVQVVEMVLDAQLDRVSLELVAREARAEERGLVHRVYVFSGGGEDEQAPTGFGVHVFVDPMHGQAPERLVVEGQLDGERVVVLVEDGAVEGGAAVVLPEEGEAELVVLAAEGAEACVEHDFADDGQAVYARIHVGLA